MSRQYKISATILEGWYLSKEYPDGIYLLKKNNEDDFVDDEDTMTSEEVREFERLNYPIDFNEAFKNNN